MNDKPQCAHSWLRTEKKNDTFYLSMFSLLGYECCYIFKITAQNFIVIEDTRKVCNNSSCSNTIFENKIQKYFL